MAPQSPCSKTTPYDLPFFPVIIPTNNVLRLRRLRSPFLNFIAFPVTTLTQLVARRTLSKTRSETTIATFPRGKSWTSVCSLRTLSGLNLPIGLLSISSPGLPKSVRLTLSCRPTLREKVFVPPPFALARLMAPSIPRTPLLGTLRRSVCIPTPLYVARPLQTGGALTSVLTLVRLVCAYPRFLKQTLLDAGPNNLATAPNSADPFVLPVFKSLHI